MSPVDSSPEYVAYFCLCRIIPFLLVSTKNKYFLDTPTLVGKIKKKRRKKKKKNKV